MRSDFSEHYGGPAFEAAYLHDSAGAWDARREQTKKACFVLQKIARHLLCFLPGFVKNIVQVRGNPDGSQSSLLGFPRYGNAPIRLWAGPATPGISLHREQYSTEGTSLQYHSKYLTS